MCSAHAIQFLTIDDVIAGCEALANLFAARHPEVATADNVSTVQVDGCAVILCPGAHNSADSVPRGFTRCFSAAGARNRG